MSLHEKSESPVAIMYLYLRICVVVHPKLRDRDCLISGASRVRSAILTLTCDKGCIIINSLRPDDSRMCQYTWPLYIIGSDFDLSPVRSEAFIWTNASVLLIRPSGTHFSHIWTKHCCFFPENAFKIYSAKLTSFCLGLDVLTVEGPLDVAKSRRPQSCTDNSAMTPYFLWGQHWDIQIYVSIGVIFIAKPKTSHDSQS